MHQLNGILQHRSVRTSADFAQKAQQSADHMERMTIDMHEIAKKTKQETVSMRVITTVTLFFLPATFIAVSSKAP
jgi:Mg2+ and Co2+ transporter CorA